MDLIKDPRVLFYLKHQALIEQWAAVRKDLVAIAHDFYVSIGQKLEERAPELGPDVRVFSMSDEAYPFVGYHRSGWHLDPEDRPLVGVYLQWRKGQSTFADGPRFICVSVNINHPSGAVLSEAFTAQVKDSLANVGFKKSSNWWPAYADLIPPTPADYWEDLNPYRDSIVESITSGWNHFAPAVDNAVSTAQI